MFIYRETNLYLAVGENKYFAKSDFQFLEHYGEMHVPI